MALRKALALHRSAPRSPKARACESRAGLPRKVAWRTQGDRRSDVGKPRADLRREPSHPNANGERPHRLRACGGFRRSSARREALHRLRTSPRKLEILAHGGQRLGVSLIGVYQRISNPHVEALMRSMREPLYKAGLTPKTPMAARALFRAIKDGACPCFLADLRDDNGPFVPFFGQPARSTVFPALLARTTGVPLYAGAAFRRPGARFSIRIAPISMPKTNDSAADALAASKPCIASTRLSSARRPNNGCGRTGSGTNRYRHHTREKLGPEESHRGGDHSSDFSRGFFSARRP